MLENAGHGHAQAGHMRAAVALRNVVRIGGKDFAVAVLPLHGDLDLNGDAVFVDRFLGVEDLLVEHRAALVLELDVGDEALVRQKLGFVCGALVLELDENTGVEERKLAQAREQGVVVELGDLLEDLRVGQEVHFRAATARRTEKLHRRDEDFGARDGILGRFSEAVLALAAFEFEETGFAVAAHDEAQPGRKRVHAGDADAVQAAGDLVAVVVELAAGMKFGQGDFRCAALGLVLVVPLDGRGNAAAVVHDGNRVVRVDGDLNLRGVACKSFVDGVVDNFINQMMKPGAVGGVADVHARTLANGFQALQNLDAVLVVGRRSGRLLIAVRVHFGH